MVLSSGKVEDQAALDVQVGLAVQAPGELAAAAELLQDGRADVGHDPHVQDDVDAVGQLHADLAEGRADGPHRKGDHVHLPPPHRTLEDLARAAIAFLGRHPVVGRAGILAQRAADERQVFGPRHVVDGRAVIETAGKFLLIQQGHFARLHGLLREAIFFFLRPVDPNNRIRLAQTSHFLDPFLEFPMLIHLIFPWPYSEFLNNTNTLS